MRSRPTLHAVLLLAIAFIAGASRLDAKDPRFQWIYGEDDYDIFNGMVATADGGYLAVGLSGSFGAGPGNDVYVVRTDACGVLQWSATYDLGNGGYDNASKVVLAHGGGYVIVGSTQNIEPCCSTGYDPFVMKIDDAGNVLWAKTYPGLNDDYGMDIARYGNSEYVIAGSTQSFGNGETDGFLMRIGLTGIPVYARAYGGASWDEFTSVAVATNGEIIAAGNTTSYAGGASVQIYTLRARPDLTTVWSYHYGGDASQEQANDVVALGNGTIAVLGYSTVNSPSSFEQPYMLKLASTGLCICQTIFAFADTNLGELTEGVELVNGEMAVTGFYFNQPSGLGRFDVLLLRINTDCDKVWAREFGVEWRDQGRAILPVYSAAQLLPTGYVIAGSTNSFNNGGFDDAYLIQTDRFGASGCNEYKTVMAQYAPGNCAREAPTTANLFAVSCTINPRPLYNRESELICRDCLNVLDGDIDPDLLTRQ
jgi:hypothetical protein